MQGAETTEVDVQSCHGYHRFHLLLQADGLNPWDSEPPGGMFPPGSAQLPCPNPTWSSFLREWLNLQTGEAAEPGIESSSLGV